MPARSSSLGKVPTSLPWGERDHTHFHIPTRLKIYKELRWWTVCLEPGWDIESEALGPGQLSFLSAQHLLLSYKPPSISPTNTELLRDPHSKTRFEDATHGQHESLPANQEPREPSQPQSKVLHKHCSSPCPARDGQKDPP